jgi:hypothetical protein
MSNEHPTRESMSLEEAAVSNMWEIAAIVEVLERKDLVHTTSPGGGVHFPASS